MRSSVTTYGVTFAAVAVACLTRWLLDPVMGDSLPLVTQFGAVAVAVWIGGYRPALLAVVLGYLACAFLFIEPRGSLALNEARNIVGLFAYLVTCFIIIWFGEAMRVSQRRSRNAEETARQQAELHRTTLISIGDAVITTDTQGRITNLNTMAESLTGWTNNEAVKQPLEAVFHILNETTRLPIESPTVRSLREGVVVGLANHTVLIAKDGTERPIDDCASPIRYKDGDIVGCVLVFRDVTEQRRHERELESREQQFRTLAESIPQLTWMANSDGHIFWYNRRWYDYTGTTFEQMEGWGWQSVHDPQELPKVLERWQASIDTCEPFDMVFPLKGKDGLFRSFLTRIMPVKDETGRVVRWFGTNTDITEAKQTEEKLREARSRLESTLAAGEIGTWEFDAINNIVRADANFARMCNVTPDQEAGGPLEAYMTAIHPDDRNQVAGTIRQALENGENYEAEYRLIGPNGTVRWVVARGRVERDESGRAIRLPGVVVDITAQRRAEERGRQLTVEAETANAQFRAFFEQGAIFAGIMNIDGTIIEPNRLCLEACGYTKEQVVGKLFWECPWWNRSADLMERIKAASEQAAAGKTFRGEMPYFVADGSERMVDLSVLPIKDQSGKVLFLAPTGTDITDRKRAEEGLREADRHKDEFLATLAHELRNPLAPLRNGLQIMKLARNNADAVDQARAMMERQLGQMVHLIDDLLDVSRISRGKVELRKERVELAKVVQHAVETSRPLIEQADHELTVTVPPDPIYVDADLTRLAQVFANLLNNAAKYTEEGGHIWLTVERQGSEAVVTVRDNGVGIPAHMLPKVFEMFTQVDRSLEKSQGGLGIGLSLVKGLVEMHGGSVEARSEGHGAGSEFIVRVPVVLSLVGQGWDDSGAEAKKTNTHRRILVVDDNRDGANSLAMMLRIMGNETKTAHDGLEALNVAAAFKPDLVMLDIGMPKLNGYDTARRIREQPWGRSMVLVALTGWGQEEDRLKSQEAGFDFHMVKPIEPASLEELLTSLKVNTA